MEKIVSAIALRQVDLSTQVDGVNKLLDSIYQLYTKLCDADFFTQETQQSVEKIQGEIQASGTTMQTIPSDSQLHFQHMLYTQSTFSKL